MPNWCHNSLSISSENEEQLNDFVNAVKDSDNQTDLSLSKLLPCPNELLKTAYPNKKLSHDKCCKLEMKYGHADWYDWCIANWGTKWNVKAVLNTDKQNYVDYIFDSANSPPLEWIAYVALEFSDLEFELTYIEPLGGFQGKFNAHGRKTCNSWNKHTVH